ncbi:MAG: hypothetical protein ACRDN0_39835 [Trebonia sp.]
MPLPEVLGKYNNPLTDPNDTDGVRKAYEQLVPYEIGRIARTIEKLPTATAGRLDPLRIQAAADWAAAGGWPVAARPANLKALVIRVNALQKDANDALASLSKPEDPDDTGQQKKKAQPPVTGNKELDKAIDLLQVKVVGALAGNDPAVTASVKLLFGQVARDARPRFGRIAALLRDLYNRPEKNPGFVLDPALPASMGALATRTTKNWYIRLSQSALDGSMGAPRLAATLMHEGSHLIDDPTIDFAYRDSGYHYFLPEPLALFNAANYEQVAADAVGALSADPPSADEVTRQRALTGNPGLIAGSLLSLQIPRAWVLAYNLGGAAHPDPSIVALLGLPTPAWAAPLARALIDGLFNGMDLLNSTAQGGIDLREGDMHVTEPRLAPREGSRSPVLVPAEYLRGHRPADLARDVLRMLCRRVVEVSGAPQTPDQLLTFITDHSAIENDHLRGLVASYAFRVGQAPSTSEELDEYYRNRVDDV